MRTALSVSLRRLRSLLVVGLIAALCGVTPDVFAKAKAKKAEGDGEVAKERTEKPKAEPEAEAADTVVIADEAALLTVLNQGDVKVLQLLPGVGKTIAGAIIAARPIAALDDLLKVEGIAAKRLEKIKSAIGKTKVPAAVFAKEAADK